MENASNALLIAGGVLIALLVIGALMLMFNQISNYQDTKANIEVVDSVSQYNEQFTRFTDDNTKGYQLITLMNKIIENNQKDGVVDSVNYSDAYNVTMQITLGNDFRTKYGITKQVFKLDNYEIKNKTDTFYSVIKTFTDLETTYTLNVMSTLSANYDKIQNEINKEKENNGKTETQVLEEMIPNIVGRRVAKADGSIIDLSTIAQYREYSDFKTSTFKVKNIDYYKNGQIKSLSFEFLK